MRSLAGLSCRAVSAAGGDTSSPRRAARGASTVALALLAACGTDSLTDPTGRMLAPSSAVRALTGATSTPIFPIVPPGETQPTGDARGLNASGQVTGAVKDLPTVTLDFKPYRYTPGSGVAPLAGCCDTQWGADINDAGVVVGTTQQSLIVGTRGFVAVGTSFVTLSILPGSSVELAARAFAINAAGQIVGYSPTPSSSRHAVLWSPAGVIQDLGTLGGSNSEAFDINASGQVIGSSQIAGDAVTHFFLWSTAGGMQDLNTLIGPAITSVLEINDAGQITGTYTTASGQSHAFLYTPGSGLRDLGTLGGATSAPTGLNNLGQVVGTSTTAAGATHAFLWTPTDGMEDITAITGVNNVGRLNDNLQTVTGFVPRTASPSFSTSVIPQRVQLQFTPTAADAAPVAAFTWSCERKKCSFDASSSTDDNGIVSYVWDFDKEKGGGKSTGVVVKTAYPKGGTHEVMLTVTDTKGQTASVTQTVALP
ncbi:MAG TPA: PKD domain-containing protein [Gemmatimonadaceae bacterium]|nr:PKD domain-containing protein [Gemmatimonadaceae bacterium]